MKKNLAKKITLSILASAVLMSSSVVWAAPVTTPPPGTGWTAAYPWLYHTSGKEIQFGTGVSVADVSFASAFYSNGDATDGKVTIDGGIFENLVVYGGHVDGAGAATNNTVTINDGTFGDDNCWVYGGYVQNTGAATNNTVTINDGAFYGIYGGYVDMNGAATNNTVTINDGTFSVVYGGYVNDTGNAKDNTVTISGGTFKYEVYGGCSDGDSATNNTVTIGGGTFDNINVYGGCVHGGNGYAEWNIVTISGGTFDDIGVRGGYVVGRSTGDASHNEVVISNVEANSTFGYITGGEAYGDNGNADNNRVTLSAKDAIYNEDIYGGFSYEVDANNNAVNISAGTFNNIGVYGGYAGSGDAKGNTVTISGTANLEYVNLYGGAHWDDDVNKYVGIYGGEGVNANTLNIGVEGTNSAGTAWNPTSRKLQSIQGFDVINIYGVEWNEAEPHIKVDDIELKDTKINAYVSGEEGAVNSKKMTLIDATNITKVASATDYLHSGSKVNLFEGIANVYTGKIAVDENDIIISLEDKHPVTPPTDDDTPPVTPPADDDTPPVIPPTGGEDGGTPTPERNDQVLVLGESRAAAVAFTNQGSELIELGLNALARDNSKDTKVFAAVYGNHSEYETGSHVNVNGWSGIVGIGKTNANGLTVGAFFENGEGNYSTHNDYNAQYIRGDGEANYNGGGLLVRKDNANGVYAEASLRAGNLQNELRNAVRNGQDLTGYDVDTFYYGAHIGIGKVIPRGADGDSLDVYGKFIYTHHDGETFDVGGTPTKFDSVESERLRLGFRLNEVQTNKLSMYYGAAWEYEFNGDAHDKIASFDLETPSLEGSTVIGEVGAHYKASEKWSLDLNARAYTGQREGFSGSVQANYAF